MPGSRLRRRTRIVNGYFDKDILTFIPVNAKIDQRFEIDKTYWSENIVELFVVEYQAGTFVEFVPLLYLPVEILVDYRV